MMRVDLLIEPDTSSATPWVTMARELLPHTRKNPHFSLMSGASERADGKRPQAIRLALCTMAIDLDAVMSIVFPAIESAGAATGAPFTVRLDPGPELAAGRMLSDLHAHAGPAIAAARALEDDGGAPTVDSLRRVFQRVTGAEHTAVIRHEGAASPKGYSTMLPNGRTLFATTSPVGRGWLVIERNSRGEGIRAWTTAPQYQHFGLCLQLDRYLADVDEPLDLVFSHAEIAFNADANPNRSYFSSAIGPLSVHSRELGAGSGRLEFAIVLPHRGQIRSYIVKRGTLPRTYQLVDAVPF